MRRASGASGAFALVAALVVSFAAVAFERTVHRENMPAGAATPSGASFTVRMPVPYNDVELRIDDPDVPFNVVRMITGATDDRVRLSAMEMPFAPGEDRKPLEDFMKPLREEPAVSDIVDVRQGKSGDGETLSFTLLDVAGGGNYYDVIRTAGSQYTLLIQFHPGQRDKAAAMKDAFFGSFKINKP
jgi:hypothetical protein